ncbi:MAG: hypothetical protein SFU99_13815 [Saprospiraceae bacterium]|nr:hypothetical protein [Saprospiraceae bacterium]
MSIIFDPYNPISSPKAISFQGEGNRKFINMGEALKNFNEKGCKDTLINGIPKFAPLE